MQAPEEPALTRPTVVIVTHETRNEVLGCLDSLAGHAVGEVAVVDTGSTDGTAHAVRARYPDVRVVELANAGFGRGANTGVRLTGGQAVVIANADVRFRADCVARLADGLRDDPTLAMVGPAVRYPDGRPQASARRLPAVTTAAGHALFGRLLPGNRWTRRYRALDAPPDEPRDADWLSGCAVAVRRTAFEEVGGFDPGYHLYVEDVDLGLRLRDRGWRLRYLPSAAVAHRVGASTRRRRGRALLTHGRSLDRFHRHHYASAWSRLLRPAVRLGLATWVAVTWGAERLTGNGRSSTGERTNDGRGRDG